MRCSVKQKLQPSNMKKTYLLHKLSQLGLLAALSSSISLGIDYNPAAMEIIGECVGDISESIEYRGSNSYFVNYGIIVTKGGSTGDISSDISVTNYLLGPVVGIAQDTSSSIESISASITLTISDGNAVGYLAGYIVDLFALGIYNESPDDSTGITIDWSKLNLSINSTVGAEEYGSYGLYLNQAGTSIATGEGEYIGGSITAYSDYYAGSYGIYSAESATIGDIGESGSITAINESGGNATGIELKDSSLGNIAGSVTATAQRGDAVGIELDNSSIGTISGSVSSYSQKANSTGILYSSGDTLQFSDNASISATTKSGLGTAIENTTMGISLNSSSGTTSIEGNLNAGNQQLTFEQGQYSINSDSWSAESISIGSDGGTTQISLSSSLELDASILDFYVNDLDDLSMISIADGSSLDLSDVITINVYLEDGVMESGDFELTLMDGTLEGLAEDVQVNYILSENYTDEFLSYGAADDGTSFIVSQNTDVVPEPCTVSLSLVALAGLMMRRRRKASHRSAS